MKTQDVVKWIKIWREMEINPNEREEEISLPKSSIIFVYFLKIENTSNSLVWFHLCCLTSKAIKSLLRYLKLACDNSLAHSLYLVYFKKKMEVI